MNAEVLVKSIDLLDKEADNLLKIDCVYDSYDFTIWYKKVCIIFSKLPNKLIKHFNDFSKVSFKNSYDKYDIGYDLQMKRLYYSRINKIRGIFKLLRYDVTLTYDADSIIDEVVADKMEYQEVEKEILEKTEKVDKIFISHAYKDKRYIKLFVELLEGIGLTNKEIFCSSIVGYMIPNDKNIYDYLKEELNKNTKVLFVLSDNYYRSPACLNEMGATWVLSNNYSTILLPNFEFEKIKGAIDPMRISYRLNDEYRIIGLKKELEDIFELQVDEVLWRKKLNEYLNEVNKLIHDEKKLSKDFETKIENVRMTRNGKYKYIEIRLRIMNNGKVPVQLNELKIQLEDSYGKTYVLDLDSAEYEEIFGTIYNSENRVEIIEILLEEDEFKPNKTVLSKCKCDPEYNNAY